VRWDEVAWQYATYNHPTLAALQEGRVAEALTLFAGLHPPLYPLLHSLMSWIWPAPLLWLLFSVAASTGAVVLTLRGGRLAALLLACGAVQLAYAAEVNNYPLTALVVAAIWWARDRVACGRPWWELAIVGVVAVWTHGLAGWIAGIAALTLGPAVAFKVGATMALGVAPLTPSLVALITEPGTFRQPPIKPGLIGADLISRFGIQWVVLLPLAALGARKRPALAVGLVATEGFILALQFWGVAAPHQFPYHLAAGIPLAWLVAAGVANSSRWRVPATGVAIGVAVLQAGGSLWLDAGSLARIIQDPARGLDTALAEASPGDAIILLTPPRLPDDDKRASSPVLWRIRPWHRLPAAAPTPFDYADHRYGQPRLFEGITIYLHELPRETLNQAVQAHPKTWIVVYDHRGDPRFTRQLDERFGPGSSVGPDRLHRLSRDAPAPTH
jgi:hypothetical protein